MLLEEGACYDHCVLGKILLDFALLHFVLQAKLACYSRYLFTVCFCIAIPYDGKDLLLVLVLEGLVGLHRTSQLQLLWHQWLGHRPGLLWC